MKNYIICVNQEEPHGFCKNFQILKAWKYSYFTFYTSSKSFTAAEFISVQSRESKKQLEKKRCTIPTKEWKRGPILLVTLKSRITLSMLTQMSLCILLSLFPQNYLQLSVSILSFKNYLLCRKYTQNSKLRHFKRKQNKNPSFHLKQWIRSQRPVDRKLTMILTANHQINLLFSLK